MDFVCTRTKTGLRGIKVDSHGNQLSEFSHDSLRIVLSSLTVDSNDGTPCFYFILLNFSDVKVCRQKILLFISQWAQWAHPLWNTMCRCVLRVQPTGVKPSKKRWNAMHWSIVSITPGLRKSKRWYFILSIQTDYHKANRKGNTAEPCLKDSFLFHKRKHLCCL